MDIFSKFNTTMLRYSDYDPWVLSYSRQGGEWRYRLYFGPMKFEYRSFVALVEAYNAFTAKNLNITVKEIEPFTKVVELLLDSKKLIAISPLDDNGRYGYMIVTSNDGLDMPHAVFVFAEDWSGIITSVQESLI